jgi:16S rRNA (cytidine1402-2'-O)-methyltransferase
MPGTLFVVATPIGNLEDVTARALRVLRESAVIAAEDTRRTAHLLARYGITTPTTSLHEHNETRKAASLIDRLRAGDNVALVSDAGTPTVSDPGQRLIEGAIEAGVRVESIPGPSAVLTALAASGLPTDTFTFLGFPPTRSKDRKDWFEEVRKAGRTVVFFEAPHRVRSTLEQLMVAVGDCRICLGRELTKVHEELVRGPISDVLQAVSEPRGEYTVVADIGHITEYTGEAEASPADLAKELGYMTATEGFTRRRAISALARKHGLSPNRVYGLLEEAKKSVK